MYISIKERQEKDVNEDGPCALSTVLINCTKLNRKDLIDLLIYIWYPIVFSLLIQKVKIKLCLSSVKLLFPTSTRGGGETQ